MNLIYKSLSSWSQAPKVYHRVESLPHILSRFEFEN